MDNRNLLSNFILPDVINKYCYGTFFIFLVGRDSAVGIGTRYGLDGPESNPGGSEVFRICLDGLWGTPNLVYNGYRVFPGGKAAWAWR